MQLAERSQWYRDGVNHADPYRAEPTALRHLRELDNGLPELAVVLAKWPWIFDEDMTPNESTMISYIAALATSPTTVRLAELIADFPWMQDGPHDAEVHAFWGAAEVRAIESLYLLAKRYGEVDFAIELAALPWVVDGVTIVESQFGLGSIASFAGRTEAGFTDVSSGQNWTNEMPASLELARRMLSLVNSSPEEADFLLLMRLNTIREWYPDRFVRLLERPWFVDGLDAEERIFLSSAAWAEALLNVDEPYNMASATVALPLAGHVNLHVVWVSPPNTEDRILTDMEADTILADMEKAVRGSEQFWGLPFPTDDVILVTEEFDRCYRLERFDCRGAFGGGIMALFTSEGEIPPETLAHEVAHYYFDAGPRWFTEGGAELVRAWMHYGGDVPTIQPAASCEEISNLQEWTEIAGGSLWDWCSYRMGLYFLATVRDAVGHHAFTSALRSLYLKYGVPQQYIQLLDSADAHLDDEAIYQAFMAHTPSHLVDDVTDVFRRLHGGPFINASDTER